MIKITIKNFNTVPELTESHAEMIHIVKKYFKYKLKFLNSI